MKITIENTSEVITLATEGKSRGIPARVWQGVTESGIKVQCLITRIAVPIGEDQSQFEAELAEKPVPREGERAFPMRMIL
jgi:hypothetical protein